jgi:3-deoxy-D-manno-octulosonate 8-phosphate phosphatase (KDO 8-P phosphatase)
MTNTIENKPKLLVLDVDGVLTSGKKMYDQSGAVIGKEFADLDFTAIKAFKALGVAVVWLSGDSNVNRHIANLRNIPFYHTRKENIAQKKAEYIPILCERYNATAADIWFVGDDIFDGSMFNSVGKSFCVSNSPSLVKALADVCIPKASGDYIILWLLEYFINKFNLKFPSEETIVEVEKQEAALY